MSSEEQQNTNIEEKNNDSNNKQSNSNQANQNDVKELMKIPFVKDLYTKFEYLRVAMINTRTKISENEKKIKELEGDINLKLETINKLNKDKNNLEERLKLKEEEYSNLKKEKSEPEPTLMASDEIRKLNEEITNLKLENETYKKKMDITLEESENSKIEYKKQIKSLSEKNSELIEELKKIKSEKEEMESQYKEKLNSNPPPTSEFFKERQHYEDLLKEYKDEKEAAILKSKESLEKCDKLTLENNAYKESILQHEINEGKMAQKLAELKNDLLQLNLRNQIYHVKKVGIISSNEIVIIFGKDKKGNYVMRIDEKSKTDLINILDIESVNQVEKTKNKVEIKYMYKGKKHTMNILVDELIIDQFIEAYKNFYAESMKVQNHIDI